MKRSKIQQNTHVLAVRLLAAILLLSAPGCFHVGHAKRAHQLKAEGLEKKGISTRVRVIMRTDQGPKVKYAPYDAVSFGEAMDGSERISADVFDPSMPIFVIGAALLVAGAGLAVLAFANDTNEDDRTNFLLGGAGLAVGGVALGGLAMWLDPFSPFTSGIRIGEGPPLKSQHLVQGRGVKATFTW